MSKKGKRKVEKHFDEIVTPLLEPGEQRIAVVWALSGAMADRRVDRTPRGTRALDME